MVRTHNLGSPRIGKRRELKFALEAHWKDGDSDALERVGSRLREESWRAQAALDLVPVGDFSFYDQVLDHAFLFGNVPARARGANDGPFDAYFRAARGRAASDGEGPGVAASEMTKWFDTNYHYLVPEFTADTRFTLHASGLLQQVEQARRVGVEPKPVLIGPVTYLWLGKAKDGSDKLDLLERLLPRYQELLELLAASGVAWVQLDEPILVTELDGRWQAAVQKAYRALSAVRPQLLLATYFGALADNLGWVSELPVAGLHVDAVRAREELATVAARWPLDRVLSVGIVDGRNVWKTDLTQALDTLEPLRSQRGPRLWIAPSCSLLHVPVDLESERALEPELKSWLAFAVQKLEELTTLKNALNFGRASVLAELRDNAKCIAARRSSPRVHDPEVRAALEKVTASWGKRKSPYAERARTQAQRIPLPKFPTTTIGSFPQTREIRRVRSEFRAGKLDEARYRAAMRREIERAVRAQEQLDLDVLVHGEPERNDMVEYFGERLKGYAFSEFGWVQSYGSRCVKPPILFGDITRPEPMTVEWTRYAQSITERPMKGMLTGPVTLLNWSFVRDDQPRALTCLQLALAIRKEVLELEAAGVQIIQIDEAALREGLPLRKRQWADYLAWAVEAFAVAANGVRDETQIHTHMCYSEFNDILPAIAAMDADVITIETSRSDMELLRAFDEFAYPNEIGPGVYDIHSPNVPSRDHIVMLMRKAAERIPPARLWVNPDCGLKTRGWEEVIPALRNMVEAARQLRAESV